MSTIFDLDKINDSVGQLNMDELYEKKQKYDQQQLDLFNKFLGKIHGRIKYISNQRNTPLICWYPIPEIVIGVPRYDQSACIIYLLNQLTQNGFSVKYISPNLLCICWQHYIPKYIRTKIYQSTGIEVNELGDRIPDIVSVEDVKDTSHTGGGGVGIDTTNTPSGKKTKSDKNYTPVNAYKPTGNLIYDTKYLNIDS